MHVCAPLPGRGYWKLNGFVKPGQAGGWKSRRGWLSCGPSIRAPIFPADSCRSARAGEDGQHMYVHYVHPYLQYLHTYLIRRRDDSASVLASRCTCLLPFSSRR